MKTIALANQKGGVGKSTTTYHLTRAAYREGLKVLVIDLDPQGNITSSLAKDELPEGTIGLADVLSARTPETLTDVITHGLWEDVDLVPTTGEVLSYVRDELVVAGAGRETRLKKALETVANEYDLCLIYCPPSIDQLTINGLTAADQVLVITQSKQWSVNGLAHLTESINQVKEYYNPQLSIAGIVINQHEGKTITGTRWINELTQYANANEITIFTPPIPKRVTIGDTVEASQPLDLWASQDAADLANIYTTYLLKLTTI